MKFITFIWLIIFLLIWQTEAQSKIGPDKIERQISNLKLLEEKPSVYITFEEYGKFTSDKTKETYDIIWFRLHNNLKGDISFCYYDQSVSPTGKIGLHYLVEKHLDLTDLSTRNNKSVPLGFPPNDVCDVYKLGSGKTFLFGVPESHLIKGTFIKVQFFYPWENANESLTGKEPEHNAYFFQIDLPKKN